MTSHSVTSLSAGIYCIDANYIRPRLACSYLIVHQGKAAFIDCGTSYSTPHLLSALMDIGLTADDVEYIIPTHVHLDHAGGAGRLMQACPNAVLLAHPRGLRHLINPQRLVESARSVYGADKFDALYGDILPVEEQRTQAAEDQSEFSLNGRTLYFADTPGHARHHFCVYDEISRGWFTGDTFGLSYPDLTIRSGQYIMPTTTPTQFEPDAWQATLDKLLENQPLRMYLTHYGMIENTGRYAAKLRSDLQSYCDLASRLKGQDNREQSLEDTLMTFTLKDLKNSGCTLSDPEIKYLISDDIKLNAQGLDIWLSRSA